MLMSGNKDKELKETLYCKFANFRENFIFANSVKSHIWDVKNLRLGHD